MTTHEGLEIVSFASLDDLHAWLAGQPTTHDGVWVRLFTARSGMPSVAFSDLLEEGLCYGWSESTRHPYDEVSYLQRFTPRRRRGTASERNRRLVARLTEGGRMTPAGFGALGFGDRGPPVG